MNIVLYCEYLRTFLVYWLNTIEKDHAKFYLSFQIEILENVVESKYQIKVWSYNHKLCRGDFHQIFHRNVLMMLDIYIVFSSLLCFSIQTFIFYNLIYYFHNKDLWYCLYFMLTWLNTINLFEKTSLMIPTTKYFKIY